MKQAGSDRHPERARAAAAAGWVMVWWAVILAVAIVVGLALAGCATMAQPGLSAAQKAGLAESRAFLDRAAQAYAMLDPLEAQS